MSLVSAPLVRLTASQLRHSRKTMMALLVSLVPFAVGLLMALGNGIDKAEGSSFGRYYEHDAGFSGPAAFLILGGTVPLVALLLAGGLVAEEVEDRTLSYLLVRPLRRSTIVVSKFIPVAALAALLGALQVLLFGLTRLVAWALLDPGATATFGASDEKAVNIGLLLAWSIPVGMVAAAFVATTLSAVFGFVSLLTTRFHFIVNLLVLLAFELPFANLGGLGLGAFTSIFHGVSLLDRADPTQSLTGAPAPMWLALLFLPAWAALWLWLACRRASRRDFNITSAAS